MNEEQKQEIISSVKKQVPNAADERLRVLLELILLEIESYNTCGNVIPWEKLVAVIKEVLYLTVKNELEKTVESVKRGDTSITYATTTGQIQGLLTGYDDLIKRLIGCDGLVFY